MPEDDKKIVKQTTIFLTEEECNSPLPIEMIINVVEIETQESITYTITYPKN